jgi:hypothetical protein
VSVSCARMATIAELTITKPGKEADAVLEEIAGFVAVERTGDTTATLTFEHANALAAVPVLATFLRRQGHADWDDYVEVTTTAPTLVGKTVPRTRNARGA